MAVTVKDQNPVKQIAPEPAVGQEGPRPELPARGPGVSILRLQSTHGNRAVMRMLDQARPVIQRQRCACGGEAGADGECASCAAKRRAIQREPAPGAAAVPHAAPSLVHETARSAGQPLDMSVRSEMESHFGHDFGDVRVHTDSRAAASARAIDARAYTIGHNIVFATGQHAPHSGAGRRLLAHELAHVVQQSNANSTIQTAPDGIAPADGYHEHEAEAAAQAVLAGGRPAALAPVRGSILRAPEVPTETPPSVGMSASLSGLSFDVPDHIRYKAGRKTPQLLAIILGRLLGAKYDPAFVAEVETILNKGKFERYGGFRSAKPAKAGEEIGHVDLGLTPSLAVISFLRSKKLELQLTPEQEDLLVLGYASLNLWDEFIRSLKEWDIPLPSWYSREIFNREMAQHGLMLRDYAVLLAQSQAGETAAFAGIGMTIGQIMTALYQPAMVLEAIRIDTKLAANEKTAGAYGAIWRLPKPKKGEPIRITAPPTRLNNPGAAVVLLGYMRTQAHLARDAETDEAARVQLMTNYAGYTQRMLFEGTFQEGDEVIRDRPGTANAPAFPSTLSPVSASPIPPFEAALGTDFRFNMEVQFPSVYEALGRYAFNWERVRIPDEQIGEPIDVSKMRGEEVSHGEVAAVRFSRTTAYAKEDIKRVVDSMQSDIGPAGVGALNLVGANAILRYLGTGIKMAIEILTMPAHQKLIVFPTPGLYFVRSAMSQVREGTEQVVRAPSVAYYPVLARDPDEMAAGGVKTALARREKAHEQIKKLEATLANGNLGKEEKEQAEQELAALRQSLAPLGERLTTLRDEAAKRVEAIKAGTQQGDLDAATKDLEHIEKLIKRRTDRKVGDAELLTAQFVSDFGQKMSLTLEVVDKPTTTTKRGDTYHVYISDVTTPKSGDETGTGKSRDDAIVDAVKTLLESTEGYGRGRVALGLSGGIRTIRIGASKGSLLAESIDNVTTALSIAAVVAAPLTGGASLMFLIPLGLAGAIPSAYRISQRLESGTFELDLENALEIVNIAGSVIGLGRMGATSLRMMRLGKAMLIVGFGIDAAGGVMMSVQFMQQVDALAKIKDPGERAAALMMLIGQTMLSTGVMVGGSLAERSHHVNAEAQVGKPKGLIDEKPIGTPDPAKVPAADAPGAKQIPESPAAIPEKVRIDTEMQRIGGVDPDTDAKLRANEPLRKALVDQPLAAAALKKCKSPCYPPNVTPQQVARLDQLLSRVKETGGYDEQALKKYLYERRDNLNQAIAQLEGANNGAALDARLKMFNEGGESPKPVASEPPRPVQEPSTSAPQPREVSEADPAPADVDPTFSMHIGEKRAAQIQSGERDFALDRAMTFDIDEVLPVGADDIKPQRAVGRALDPYNRQLLDPNTNQRTKGLGIDPRELRSNRGELPPVSVVDKPEALLTRRFSEVEELSRIFDRAVASVREPQTLRPTELKARINKEIRRIITEGTDPDAVAVRTALESLGFQRQPGRGFTLTK